MERFYFPPLSLFPVLENKNVTFSCWCGVVRAKRTAKAIHVNAFSDSREALCCAG